MAVNSPYVGLGVLLPFGNVDTQVVSRNDDGSSPAINITPIFANGIKIGTQTYTQLYVNTNGNVTFGQSLSTYTPGPIASQSFPIIAPYWADFDTRLPSGAQESANGRVYWDFDTTRDSIIVTWHDIGYFNVKTDKKNTVQLEITDTGNGNFNMTFRYADINWTTGDASSGVNGLGGRPARFGYSLGDFVFEPSISGNQDQMLALESSVGNAGVGRWFFTFAGGAQQNTGTEGADTFVGTQGNDQWFGLGGNDTATGVNGDDFLDLQAGDDSANGGAGNDTLLGGTGNDTLIGGPGADFLNGGDGNDTADYSAETQTVAVGLGFGLVFTESDGQFDTLTSIETVIGGSAVDFFAGADVAERLEGRGGGDLIWGYGGNDTLLGGDGNDILVGGAGNDSLEGGTGSDWMYGEAGNDVIRANSAPADGYNVLVGGDGNDSLYGGTGGFDYFYGGDGATGGGNDTFFIGPNSGIKVFNDFEAGGANDVVRLQGTALTSFAQVQAAMSNSTYVNGAVVVVDATTQLWFVNVAPNTLTAADFQFA